MVFKDGQSTTQRIVNHRGLSGVEREGIGGCHRLSPIQGIAGDATSLGQGGGSLPHRPRADHSHDPGARRSAGADVGNRNRTASDDAARSRGFVDDASDLDPRALNELSSEDRRLRGCASARERDAGFVLAAALVVAAIVLAAIVFG